MSQTKSRNNLIERWIFWPDTHLPFEDKEAVNAALELVADIQPFGVCQLGDLMDCYAISDHLRDPKRLLSLQDEIEAAEQFWAKMRKAAPKAQLVWRGGNHEDRLRKTLFKNPQIASLKDVTIPALTHLDKYDVLWVDYGDKLIFHDSLLVPHGAAIRAQAGMSANVELMKRGMSGVSGHVHRGGMSFVTDERGTRFWMESCHMASNALASYMADLTPNWQKGITVIDWDGDNWWPWLLLFQNGRFYFEGKFYDGKSREM